MKCDNSIYSNCIKNKLKGYDVLKKKFLQTLKSCRKKTAFQRHDIRQHFSTNTGKRKKQQEKIEEIPDKGIGKRKTNQKKQQKRGLKIAKKD